MLAEQIVDDRLAGRTVEIAGRLVGQQERRTGDKGAGDRDGLLLAARKLSRIMPQPMPGPTLSAPPRPAPRRRAARPVRAGSRHLARRHRRQQMEALEHDPDMIPPQPRQAALVEHGEILPGDHVRPALGRSMPATTIIRLDLPDPDGPTSATVSPGPIASEMPRRISRPGPARALPDVTSEPIEEQGPAARSAAPDRKKTATFNLQTRRSSSAIWRSRRFSTRPAA